MNNAELNAAIGSIRRQADKLWSRSSSLADQVNEFRRQVGEIVSPHRRAPKPRG